MQAFTPTPAVQRLPFQVSLAITRVQRQAVADLRSSAYGRHDYPCGVADRLRQLDDSDLRATVLMAHVPRTGAVLGTLRLNCSRRVPGSLPRGFPLQELRGESWTYVDRFALQGSGDPTVALALMKAAWHWAAHNRSTWVLAAALPPLARRYRQIALRPLVGGEAGLALPELHAEPYQVLGERVWAIPDLIRALSPRLVPFFIECDHPDITTPQVELPAPRPVTVRERVDA